MSGRTVYRPRGSNILWQFDIIEKFVGNPLLPHFHEITTPEDIYATDLLLNSWTFYHEKDLGPRDWVMMREDEEDLERVVFYSLAFEHDDDADRLVINWVNTVIVSVHFNACLGSKTGKGLITSILFPLSNHTSVFLQRDLQALLDCVSQCTESVWRNIIWQFNLDQGNGNYMRFVRRFFEKLSLSAAVLFAQARHATCILSSNGRITFSNFVFNDNSKIVSVYAEADTPIEWRVLLQLLHRKHISLVCVDLERKESRIIQISLNASEEEKERRVAAHVAAFRISELQKYENVEARFLYLSSIVTLFRACAMAVTPLQHPSLVVMEILTWTNPSFLALTDHHMNGVIESCRKILKAKQLATPSALVVTKRRLK